MSDVFFWSIFLVRSLPAMTTLKFRLFSSMKTNFSRSSKFPMSSISIAITFFMNRISAILFHRYLLCPVVKNVNQIAVNKSKIKHCLIKIIVFWLVNLY